MELLSTVSQALSSIESAVLDLGASPWLVVAVFALCLLDGVFPPFPAESIVISVTVVAVAGDLPMIYLVLLLVASTIGAICGDNISYGIGTKIPIERLRIFRAGRGERALKKIRRQMARRGTLLIMTGRFIPGGRVAVNMTSGAVAYPWRRFLIVDAIAAFVWAAYLVGMGIAAANIIADYPLLAVTIGVAGGVLVGFAVDKLLHRVFDRFFPQLPDPEEEMEIDEDGASTARQHAGASAE